MNGWIAYGLTVTLVALAFAGTSLALLVCHVRDGRRISHTQTVSAGLLGRLRRETTADVDTVLADLTGAPR